MDALTGLPDRTTFERSLADDLEQARVQALRVGVLFIDLNDFKAINDRYGHAAGDAALVQCASRIRESLRSGDLVARIGGDEFVAIIRAARENAELERVAAKVQEMLVFSIRWQQERLQVSASVGLAIGPDERMQAADLIARADAAMYERKARFKALRSGVLPPDSTPFVGREAELACIEDALRSARGLVISGIGGIGKSRLATEAARRLGARFRDGVLYFDLRSITDANLLAAALAAELHLNTPATLPLFEHVLDSLRTQERLIVFDECHHLASALETMAGAILATSPSSRMILATREPLRIDGARRLPLEPLAQDDAVLLFADRAAAVRPGFRLTAEQTAPIVQICERLDRLPLALELVAPRMSVLTAEQLLARLTGAHDPTLDALVQWHYERLPARYARIFTRAGFFTGPFTADALAALCERDSAEDVEEGIAALVTRSLLTLREAEGAQARYAMLSAVRQFAIARLEPEERSRALPQRHVAFFTKLAVEAEAEIRGEAPLPAMQRIEREEEHFRHVLAWYAQQDARHECIPLLAALGRYWYLQLAFSEAAYWLGRLVDINAPASIDLVKVLSFWALFSAHQEMLPKALQTADAAVALAGRLGDPLAEAIAFNARGNVLIETGEWVAAAQAFSEVLQSARRVGDDWWCGAALVNRSRAYLCAGSYAQAATDADDLADLAARAPAYRTVSRLTSGWVAIGFTHYDKSFALAIDALGHAHRDGERYWELAALELAALASTLDPARDGDFHERHLALAQATDDRQGQVFALVRSAAIAARSGREDALLIAGAVQSVQRRRGEALPAVYDVLMRQTLAQLHLLVSDQRFDSAIARGRELSVADAIALAAASLR